MTGPDDTSEDSGNTETENSWDSDRLVREHIEWMLALATRILGGNQDAADDVVQEAFINAFKSLDSLKDRNSIKQWLRRITVNVALNKIRQNDRLSEQSIEHLLPEFDERGCRTEAPWEGLANIEDVADNQIRLDMLDKAFSSIPEPYRIVLQLRDIEGYSTTEVAELLKISESNVKVRLHRARSALKTIIEPLLKGGD